MNAFLRRGLLLPIFSLIGLLNTLPAQAAALSYKSEAEIELTEAEAFANDSLQLMKNAFMMGTFRRGRAEDEIIFQEADTLVHELINNDELSVTKMSRDLNSVQFEVSDRDQITMTLTSVIDETARSTTKPQSNYSESSYLVASTQLVIEDSQRIENSASGFFTSISTTHRSDSDVSRVNAGIKKGPFTLSIFASPLDEGIKGGINASLRLQSKGWNFSVMGIVSESFESKVDLSTGHYRSMKAGSPDGFLNFQVDRLWTASEIKTAVGVNLYWKEVGNLRNSPDATVYLSLGKNFKDSKGRNRGAIELLGSSNVTAKLPNFFIGIRASLSF